eukprot:TRINITY_DN2201_c0_g1_i15.p1 TRINITY_DN2201_c0_g1~~TRINITY_DN2201_c0_g1_i15.p1  ORF type:complete len:163 (-),score=20.20 TRINITY_DN2201_c0_g1_i15:426-914(-)
MPEGNHPRKCYLYAHPREDMPSFKQPFDNNAWQSGLSFGNLSSSTSTVPPPSWPHNVIHHRYIQAPHPPLLEAIGQEDICWFLFVAAQQMFGFPPGIEVGQLCCLEDGVPDAVVASDQATVALTNRSVDFPRILYLLAAPVDGIFKEVNAQAAGADDGTHSR